MALQHEMAEYARDPWQDPAAVNHPIDPPQSPYPPLCRALRMASIETGIGQAELAQRLGQKLNRISTYFNNREPNIRQTILMERAFGLPSGWLLTHAGYLEPPQTMEGWISVDPTISEDGKRMLLSLLESLRAHYSQGSGAETKPRRPAMYSSRRASS